MTVTPDPFGLPGRVADRGDDPFGVPSDSGRAIRTGDAEDRAEVPRDQWGRYLMPHLDGSRPAHNKGMTRVSTTKAALSNTVGIQKWSGRRIINGLALDPAAADAARAAAAMPEGKAKEQAFGRIADGAFKTGGGKERSGLGTEFHELAELKWREQLNVEAVDPKWNADLAALDQLLTEHDVTPLAQYLERQVLCPYNQAGTFDLMARVWNRDTEEYELLMGDVKTGRKLDLGWLEILIQLWSYANAYALWTTTKIVRGDPKDAAKITDIEGFYEDMPRELRTDKAFILHVPLDGTATLYFLDLSGIERWVKAAVEAKRANAEAKNKVTLAGQVKPDAFLPQASNWAERGAAAISQPGALAAEYTKPSHVASGQLLGRVVREIADQGRGYMTPDDVAHRLAPDPRLSERIAAGLTIETHTRTPQMLADAAKAEERRALAEQVLAKVDHETQMSADKESFSEPPVTHDPVTGRKKRTCGHCHKPGHTQKNCPENPASAKYVPSSREQIDAGEFDDSSARPVPAGDPAPENNCNCQQDDDWHPYVHGMCNPAGPRAADSADGDDAPAPPPEDHSGQPFCTLSHACQWTSSHQAAPGQWVCSVSGKPGRAAWGRGQTAVTQEAPYYGAPVSEPVDVQVGGVTITDPVALAAINGAGFPPETLNAVKPPPTVFTDALVNPAGLAATGWPTAPPSLLELIERAPTQSAVLALRQEHLTAGTWTSEHDAAGMARYQTLAPQ